jgi:nucleotide-binding universal stress UspA family protein
MNAPAKIPRTPGQPKLARLLVPVDLSPRSCRAIRYAGAWAARLGAAVDLVFVLEPAPFYSGLEYNPLAIDDAALVRQARDRLRKLAETQLPKEVPTSVSVLHGRAAAQIVAVARQQKTDLIVICTHGYSGAQRVVMGSTTEEVIRQAPCPVLTLRHRTAPKAALNIRRLLAPVDFSEPSRQALQYAVGLARRLDAALTVCHVVSPVPPSRRWTTLARDLEAEAVQQAERILARWVKPAASSLGGIQTRVLVGTPRDQIIQQATALQADLVVMATHGRRGLARWLLGSTAEAVVRHAPCPVLVVRPKGT